MTKTVRALALAVFLSIGAAAVSVGNASASEVVPDPTTTLTKSGGVSSTDLSVDFGWITAKIYFNRAETSAIARGAYPASLACAFAGVWGGVAALACTLGWPRIVTGARAARDAGVCVGLRFYIGSPAINWTVRHSGSRC
jgi:hypothetical protein